MSDDRKIGLGCMRLSAVEVDEAAAIATIHAALDGGVTLLDTADVYGFGGFGEAAASMEASGDPVGQNERMIARALARWSGERSRITVATKGGLTRPDWDRGGRWIPDGRARHLAAACAASRERLGGAAIDLYQLHAPDPRTPLATSVRALAALRRGGVVRAVGLCNVNRAQLEEACRITEIAAVQVKLGPFDDGAVRGGVVELARAAGIRVLAHTPLGGPRGRGRLERDPVLASIAARLGATPVEVVLAWLVTLGVEPLPGATRPLTGRSVSAAARLALDDLALASLEERFPGLTAGRQAYGPSATQPPAVSGETDPRVILLMGIPAAGKTTLATELMTQGFERLSRDERGGRLDDIAAELDRRLAAGDRRLVLDNTYPSRRSRARVLDVAHRHRVGVRCVWLDTSIDDAAVNACDRLLSSTGEMVGPVEGAAAGGGGPGAGLAMPANPELGPTALYRFRRELEPPDSSEGFADIDVRPFRRQPWPGDARAVIVDYDAAVWRSRSGARTPADPADVEILPGRADVLTRLHGQGWLLLGTSWQPEIAAGERTLDGVARVIAHTNAALGVAVDVRICQHPAGPPICWCRKPLPGLGVLLARTYGLDLSASRHVGRGPADRGFAAKLGLSFWPADDLFR